MNKIIILAISLLPLIAHAHEDHGVSLLENFWHVFASPEHVWPLTAGMVLVIFLLVRRRL
ncbi:MAG: hypothetical protein ACI9QV_000970 [Methylophagaceae bacterium]|jgi:hypothetical protein